ncbi:catabolite repressor/activator [Avibacterium paragallinarum]|uniref:catabolite repressor/activator n=1 Tax=Avibacterium paragallinarum TaxID=728 RepID=UPI0039859892
MKLDELAKLAGVSRTTVSYVINGKAKQYRVSDKTIEKVESLIKEYDFRPNIMAAGLRAGKSNAIGLIIPDFENMSYARIAHRLEQLFRARGYQLLIACSNDNPDNEIECARHLFQRKIDALIVSSVLPESNLFYQESNIPVFGFDRKISGKNIINVFSDNKKDAYSLTQNLLELKKYRKILFFGALPDLPTSQDREAGFRQALNESKFSAVEYLYTTQFHRESASQTFAKWLAANSMPDALFVTSLTLLQGVFLALKHKRDIPSSLVIATFGNHEMLEFLENKVLCAVQDHKQIADRLLVLVLKQLNHKEYLENASSKILRRLIFRHC